MKNFLLFLFLIMFDVTLFAQTPNPPAQVKITNCNGYVHLAWRNPYPSSSYTLIKVYRDNQYLKTISNNGALSNSTIINEDRHQKHSYHLVAYNGTIPSTATTPLDGWAIRKFYIRDGGNGAKDGANYWDAFNFQDFQNDTNNEETSDGGSGWYLYNFNDDDNTSTNYSWEIGFFRGDSVIICDGPFGIGKSPVASLLISKNSDFPKKVYSGQPVDSRLLFISRHLVDANSSQAYIGLSSSGKDAFNTNGADYIQIEGIHFDGVGNAQNHYDNWCLVADESNNSVIKNNYFHFSSGKGCIKMLSRNLGEDNVTDNIIENNEVNQSEVGGVWGYQSSSNNGDFIQLGKMYDNSTGLVDNITIRYNFITMRAKSGGILGQTPADIPHSDIVQAYRLNNSTITIHNNYFQWRGKRAEDAVNVTGGQDDGAQGIHITSDLGTTSGTNIEIIVFNNVFYSDSTCKMININNNNDDGSIAPIKLTMYNNTFFQGYLGLFVKPNAIVLVQKPFNGGNKFKNNIFYQAGNNQNSTNAISFQSISYYPSASVDSIDYNLYYAPNCSTYIWWDHNDPQGTGLTEHFTCVTLNDAKNSLEQHGLGSFNPNFAVTPQSGTGTNANRPEDFIAEGIYVEDIGTNLFSLGIVTWQNDFDNCNRGTTWNRGAWEHTDGTSQIPGMEKEGNEENIKFALRQNYPNPFNPITKIYYSIPNDCNVSLLIYDALGREVMKLLEGEKSKGEYSIDFDASELGSGVYLYRLIADDFVQTKKMILLK